MKKMVALFLIIVCMSAVLVACDIPEEQPKIDLSETAKVDLVGGQAESWEIDNNPSGSLNPVPSPTPEPPNIFDNDNLDGNEKYRSENDFLYSPKGLQFRKTAYGA